MTTERQVAGFLGLCLLGFAIIGAALGRWEFLFGGVVVSLFYAGLFAVNRRKARDER